MTEKTEVGRTGEEWEQRALTESGSHVVVSRSVRSADDTSEMDKSSASADSFVTSVGIVHPSRRLDLRARGYGIAAGYEKPYRRGAPPEKASREETYGPIPHSGYYGAGEARTPFRVGQAGFKEELEWYRNQYGRDTSGYDGKKSK